MSSILLTFTAVNGIIAQSWGVRNASFEKECKGERDLYEQRPHSRQHTRMFVACWCCNRRWTKDKRRCCSTATNQSPVSNGLMTQNLTHSRALKLWWGKHVARFAHVGFNDQSPETNTEETLTKFGPLFERVRNRNETRNFYESACVCCIAGWTKALSTRRPRCISRGSMRRRWSSTPRASNSCLQARAPRPRSACSSTGPRASSNWCVKPDSQKFICTHWALGK